MSKTPKAPKVKLPKNWYTVIGYVDGDYGVDTFVEYVKATSAMNAWDVAVRKFTREADGALENDPTEIAVFAGYQESAYGIR